MFNDNKNDLHHQKELKKLHFRLLNSFFLNSFRVCVVKHHFKVSIQFLLRNFGPILTYKTKITRKLFEK